MTFQRSVTFLTQINLGKSVQVTENTEHRQFHLQKQT